MKKSRADYPNQRQQYVQVGGEVVSGHHETGEKWAEAGGDGRRG